MTQTTTKIMSALHHGRLTELLDTGASWLVKTTETDGKIISVSFTDYHEARDHFLSVVERMF